MPSDHICYIVALLHSNGRETGKQFSILLEVCGIADDKHVWVPRHAQVGFDLDTSCSIRRHSKPVSSIGCFDPSRPFVLERRDDRPVGIWGEEASKSLVLLYEPNTSLRVLHTLLVARLTLLGTGSDFLKRYLTHSQQERPLYEVQQLRLFSSPKVLENWYPHFTLLNPYTGEEGPAMASRLAQLFQSYRHIVVPTICLLIQEHHEANWQLYQEFRR